MGFWSYGILNYFCCIRLFRFHPDHKAAVTLSCLFPSSQPWQQVVYVAKPGPFAWLKNAEMAVNTHQIRSRLRAVYRESRRLSAHSLPGLIELICACPAAHSARLKMQKDSRQRRGQTKKKKGATGRVGGGGESGDRAEGRDRKRQDERLMRQSGEIETWMI